MWPSESLAGRGFNKIVAFLFGHVGMVSIYLGHRNNETPTTMNVTISTVGELEMGKRQTVTLEPAPAGSSPVIGYVVRMADGMKYHGNANKTSRRHEADIRSFMAANHIEVMCI